MKTLRTAGWTAFVGFWSVGAITIAVFISWLLSDGTSGIAGALLDWIKSLVTDYPG